MRIDKRMERRDETSSHVSQPA